MDARGDGDGSQHDPGTRSLRSTAGGVLLGAALVAAFASLGVGGATTRDGRAGTARDDRSAGVITGGVDPAGVASTAPVVFRTHAVPVFALDRARRPVGRGDRRAMDRVAREWSRALMVVVESCFADSADFTLCDTPAEIAPLVPNGLTYGNGPGTVQVVSSGVAEYALLAWSRSGRRFVTERDERGHLRQRIQRGPAPSQRAWAAPPGPRVRVVRIKPLFRIEGPRDSIRAVASQLRSRDEQAQAMAKELALTVERCGAVTHDYTQCDTSAELAPYGAASLAYGFGAGAVSVTTSSETTFTVAALSRTGSTFQITRPPGGELIRSCQTGGQTACRSDGSW